MKPKHYIALPQEAVEMNQRFITKLRFDPKRVARDRSYNATQIGNAVLGDQAWEKYSFKSKPWIPYRLILWMCIGFAVLYLALFYGWLDFLSFLFQ